MADLADVEAALAAAVNAALYPIGTGQPSAIGVDCRVYRGWPTAAALDADLTAGKVNVTIFSRPPTRKTTRYPKQWQTSAVTSPTLTVSGPVAGAGNTWQLTYGGSGGAGQMAGILVAGMPYVRALIAGDTPTTVATAFAAAIPSATSAGVVLSIPAAGTDTPVARIVGSATGWIETRRQEQHIQVDFWCPDPATRDSAVAAVDQQLANTDWLTTSDNSACRIVLSGTFVNDVPEKEHEWRRTMIYCVDYPTTLTPPQQIMLFGDLTITPSVGIIGGTAETIYV